MNVTTIGIDLAKNIIQVHGEDDRGRIVFRHRLKRERFPIFMAQQPSCVVGMEACGGAHYWARVLEEMGHRVRLLSPKHVKPYVRSDKTDRNDAEAICEAVRRPRMNFVPVKSVVQQEIQGLHRMRERLVRDRTALINQVRGFLSEFGIVTPLGANRFRSHVLKHYGELEAMLGEHGRWLLERQLAHLNDLDERISECEERLKMVFREDSTCQRIAELPGVGVLTATALAAALGDAHVFKSGRQLSAWLGLVPREHSSGGRRRLMGISKRGNRYVRTLLIHGARSAIYHASQKKDRLSVWITELRNRRGMNVASVALANKNARIIWALLTRDERYNAACA